MWLKITNTFKYYKICFQNWLNGNGFKLPKNPKTECFIEYCKQIVSDTLETPISAYEEKITRLMKEAGIASRKVAAESYIKSFDELYKEKKPW